MTGMEELISRITPKNTTCTMHHALAVDVPLQGVITIIPMIQSSRPEDGNRWSKIKRKPGAAAASYLDGPSSPIKNFAKGKVPQ